MIDLVAYSDFFRSSRCENYLVKSGVGNVNIEEGFPHLRVANGLVVSVPELETATERSDRSFRLGEEGVTGNATDRDVTEKEG